jgi:hypothetical protein
MKSSPSCVKASVSEVAPETVIEPSRSAMAVVD